MTTRAISYQGEPGANSHIACMTAYPDLTPLPCKTFQDALQAVTSGVADYAMIPIENSLAGRVADIHHLLPNADLYIVAEHFERINHMLLGTAGATLDGLASAHSHIHALGQCRNIIANLGLTAVQEADTAGAARLISERKDPTQAAIATKLAAEIYGLEILKANIQDNNSNTTRFILLSAEPHDCEVDPGNVMTTFIFRVRNVPAALYKSLGGFATNGVNMTKLESYQFGGTFNATMFYADIEGHPSERLVQLAMDELGFFSSEVRVLGSYPRSQTRDILKAEHDAPGPASAV